MSYLRFSIRTMMVVIFLVALGLAVMGWKIRHLHRIARDVAFLRATRANVDLAPPTSTLYEKIAPSFSGYPTSVRKYFDTPNLADVNAFIATITRNPTIKKLTIDGSPLDDIHVQRLLKLPLESLSINQCSIGDTLDARASESITWLGFQRTRLNDRSLVALGNLPNVKHLDLTRTRVSDDSIEFIAKLPSLKTLIASRCRISHAGKTQLASMRPDITIRWEPLRE